MLKITEYLQTHTLDDLEQKYAVKAKRHKEFPNLVLLKYSQLETKMTPMTRECRGIILNESDSFKPVCYTYRRFANYGESWADKIDYNNCHILEKLDGSLMQLYFYAGAWRVSSSGVPDASGEILNTSTTFADLFWKVWKELNYQLPEDTGVSYAFELCTIFNRVVVRHHKNRLVLTGARRLSDLRELNPVVEGHVNNWETVKTFPLNSLDEVIKAAEALDPIVGEGFVIVDTNNYNRIKVKSSSYIIFARAKDTLSTRLILNKVRANEDDEFMPKFIKEYPEYASVYADIRCKYQRLLGNIEGVHWATKDIEDRKQFAMLVKDFKFSGALFAIRFGKIDSFKQYLADMEIRHLEKWLDIKLLNL